MNTTRILLIDDHALFRSGLCMVLRARMPDIELIEAGTLNEGMQASPDTLDAVLLDIKLPGLNGVEGITLLKHKWPLVPVIILSSQDDQATVHLALVRGASGFISKADTPDKILTLLDRVLHSELIEPFAQVRNDSNQHLTLRQCEVLDLLCQGMSNKLIARKLNLSENTVRGHVQGILTFLQVSSRSEATYAARQRGLIG